jgi:hypothetical protein
MMAGSVNVIYIAIGVIATIFVLDAAIRSFVVPRGSVVLLTVIVFQGVRRVLQLFAPARRGYEAQDRVMALYAPIALLALPAVSIIIIFWAFSFIFVGLEHHGWRSAMTTSGSSLLTLGFERPTDLPSIFVAFAEAAIGLGLIAIVIAYLPTIYNSFSRRELLVTDLTIRAGTPPTPPNFLIRAHVTGFLYDMDKYWDQWMTWFTEVQETHTSYGALTFFRSPHPHRNWVTASGAVLDTMALRMAVMDMPWTPNAPLCIRSGFLSLREIAGFFGFDYDDDPAPDDPISVTRDEFDEVYDRLADNGVPLKSDRDQAWKDFAGWRVNYDAVLLSLAAFVNAPYAPWISDRSPRTPLKKYGWGRRRVQTSRRGSGPR